MAQDDQVQGDQATATPNTAGAPPSGAPPASPPLSDADRAELEQFRAQRDAQAAEQAAATTPAPSETELSEAERTELDELRAEHEARLAAEQPEQTDTPPDVGQPPTSASAVADAGPEPDELPYGTHKCPECGALVYVQYPGYADADARGREVVCENGDRFLPSSKTRVRARS